MVQTFFTLTETDILTTLEKIVTQYVKTAIHHMHFSSVTQNGLKSIQAFAVRLQSVAVDCKFICPNCQHDLSPISIKDQFILGLTSKSQQRPTSCKPQNQPYCKLKLSKQLLRSSSDYKMAQSFLLRNISTTQQAKHIQTNYLLMMWKFYSQITRIKQRII